MSKAVDCYPVLHLVNLEKTALMVFHLFSTQALTKYGKREFMIQVLLRVGHTIMIRLVRTILFKIII